MPIQLTDGSLYGTLCAVDPTPRPVRHEQSAVLQALARLLATHVELDNELSQRKVAEQRKGEIISIVSHELKTPLTSMRGSLGLLAAGLLDQQPERGRHLIAGLVQENRNDLCARNRDDFRHLHR